MQNISETTKRERDFKGKEFPLDYLEPVQREVAKIAKFCLLTEVGNNQLGTY